MNVYIVTQFHRGEARVESVWQGRHDAEARVAELRMDGLDAEYEPFVVDPIHP